MLLTAFVCAQVAAGVARFDVPIDVAAGLPDAVPVIRIPKETPRLAGASGAGDVVRTFLVDLREQLDYGRAGELLARANPSRQAQREWAIAALRKIASLGQSRLRALLDELTGQGEIQSWSGVSIVNRLVVQGRAEAVRKLAGSDEVASVAEAVEAEAALERTSPDAGNLLETTPSWPVDVIGAREAWRAGIDGKGVTVGLIDSGASSSHEQLAANFKGGEDAWFDPVNNSREPIDVRVGHGTAVLACAVGRGGEQGPVGVAPGAKWIAAVGLNQGRYNDASITRAADWMLNVGRPDVLVVPWRAARSRCDESLRGIVNAWRAAGIVVVFAAGNAGPDAGTDIAPANLSHLFPGSASALAVGAVDAHLRVYRKSSRGPSHCSKALYPQLVAPGVDVMVALPAAESLYRRTSGTSFAAGYVAGAAALLLEKFPDASVEDTEQALRAGALDLGHAGPDPVYGYGIVNVTRALEYLQRRLSQK